MGKKFKKKTPEVITFGKKKEETQTQKSNIPYHLDDKGRRVFDLDKIQKEKKEQEERRKELNKQIKLNATLVCTNCGVAFTDNMAYQEHMNSKQHNKIMGNSMNIKEVTVNTIKEKLIKFTRNATKPNARAFTL